MNCGPGPKYFANTWESNCPAQDRRRPNIIGLRRSELRGERAAVVGRRPRLSYAGQGNYSLGCETTRRYGLSVLKPCGYFFLASSSETDVGMMTSWPGFQLTGVAAVCLAVSCNESSRRSTSSKLRPVLIG